MTTAARNPSATAPSARCSCCGYSHAEHARCTRCTGVATHLADSRMPLPSGKGLWPLDLLRGAAAFAIATGQLLHHRTFVGLLKVPIAANAIAFAALAALLLFGLWPLFESWFAEPWPVLDGWRTALGGTGPVRLLLATTGLLWPVWFDVCTGALMTPLVAATERAIVGPGVDRNGDAHGIRATVEHVHSRARLFAAQVLLLPVVWLLALLPYAGLPILFAANSATAAFLWCETPALRRGLGPRQHIADLRRNWARALGFGAGCQIGMAIPFVNLLFLAPAAAVGATLLHFQFDKGTPGRSRTELEAGPAQG